MKPEIPNSQSETQIGLRVPTLRFPPQPSPSGRGWAGISAFFRSSGFGLRLFPLLALLLAGCAVGPNYQRPTALGTNAMPAGFSSETSTNGDWKPAQPSAHLPRGSWWELFGDPELTRLETLATTNNQHLAAAYANFQQARALVNVARADYFPQLAANPSYTRQRVSAGQSRGSASTSSRGYTFNNFSVPLDASWELDLWGRVRRAVEGASARFTASADDIEASKLAIQAEVAINYFTLRALDAQDQLLKETVVAYRRSLELTQNRRKGGIATELDVSQAETQLASTEAQIPAVQLQRANALHALAVLCGQAAPTFKVNTTEDALATARKAFDAGPGIPVAVPSELLERRPDIAAAERLMAAANSDVGLAYAAFYPRVMLNGSAGYLSVDANTLFNWENRAWSFGPSVSLPLFTGGRNRAQLAAARAAYDAAIANYRQTVLSAFQEVEDQLAAQRLLAQQYERENAALKSSRRTLDISMTKYKGGVITYLEVAIAQSSSLAHDQTVVQLAAQRLAASVSLIKALGAGWVADSGQVPDKKKARHR
ncbi:MAG: efflux transporter outer membrane subunit [Verrucomicrobia bacterium]|nr:efflux transporter outer membrane subunit [Verrucomicrobiota bacterium]